MKVAPANEPEEGRNRIGEHALVYETNGEGLVRWKCSCNSKGQWEWPIYKLIKANWRIHAIKKLRDSRKKVSDG